MGDPAGLRGRIASLLRSNRADLVDGVRLVHPFVGPVANDARKPQGDAAGVTGAALDTVVRDLDHQLRLDVDRPAVARAPARAERRVCQASISSVSPLKVLPRAAVLVWAGLSPAMTIQANRVLAVVFALLVVVSFLAPIAEGVAINPPHTFLHLASALITGYVGFMAARGTTTVTT